MYIQTHTSLLLNSCPKPKLGHNNGQLRIPTEQAYKEYQQFDIQSLARLDYLPLLANLHDPLTSFDKSVPVRHPLAQI